MKRAAKVKAKKNIRQNCKVLNRASLDSDFSLQISPEKSESSPENSPTMNQNGDSGKGDQQQMFSLEEVEKLMERFTLKVEVKIDQIRTESNEVLEKMIDKTKEENKKWMEEMQKENERRLKVFEQKWSGVFDKMFTDTPKAHSTKRFSDLFCDDTPESLNISYNLPKHMKDQFAACKVVKPWYGEKDRRSAFNFLEELELSSLPYCKTEGDRIMALRASLEGEPEEWIKTKDKNTPYDELKAAFLGKFWPQKVQVQEHHKFSSAKFPEYRGQSVYDFVTYWLKRLVGNSTATYESNIEDLMTKVPMQYFMPLSLYSKEDQKLTLLEKIKGIEKAYKERKKEEENSRSRYRSRSKSRSDRYSDRSGSGSSRYGSERGWSSLGSSRRSSFSDRSERSYGSRRSYRRPTPYRDSTPRYRDSAPRRKEDSHRFNESRDKTKHMSRKDKFEEDSKRRDYRSGDKKSHFELIRCILRSLKVR
ncbi:hypothetical protein U1Q18_050796 [Sarracenia purpurea var. burkii]